VYLLVTVQNNKRCKAKGIKIKYNKKLEPAFTLQIKKKNTCLFFPFNFLNLGGKNVFYIYSLFFSDMILAAGS